MLHEKVSGSRLESRIKCHGNVNKMPSTFDTFTECPLPQRLPHFAACRIIAIFGIALIAIESRITYHGLSLSFHSEHSIELFV